MRAGSVFVIWAAMLAAVSASAQLTADDVQTVINQAARRAGNIAPNSVIAVTDREGYVLGVWSVNGTQPGALEVAEAVGKAGTAAFLSSGANAFTSRTAGYIIQPHFPPGVKYSAPGPLVGVGFSNLPFSDVNRFKKPDFDPGVAVASGQSPGTLGSPVPLTSLNGIPGGVPLYKNKTLVGGVGVTGSGTEFPPTIFIADYSKDEDIALAGQKNFAPSGDILASNVFIGGFSLPYVESSAGSSGVSVPGAPASDYPITAAPAPFPYPVATFGGVEGQIRQPIIADPIATPLNGEPRLTQAEVISIINAAADRVRTTRAGIRLPIGVRMDAFITVVNNPGIRGVPPTVLGTFRTGDATIFSWDVAIQKARTAVGFSNNATAYSTRTVGFLAQSHFPPGIDPDGPGPFFLQQEVLSGFDRAALPNNFVPTMALTGPIFAPPDPTFPNGITIFPGGFPLYRNGQMIGAIGVSGDGVDQDDIVAASGTSDFLPPDSARADQHNFDGTRLPYAKFPRDPEGVITITPVKLPAFTAAAELANISVRLKVDRGERLMIGGFIVGGDQPGNIAVRALGPSLATAGIAQPLDDPALELHDGTGAVFASHFDWSDSEQAQLLASGLQPPNPREAATMQTLAPGAYTATMTGQDGGSGVGLLEVYAVDDDSLGTRVSNLSARGFVGAGDEVMIAGFIVRGGGNLNLVVRALGPTLAQSGIVEPLADPVLEIHDGNGTVIAANNDWRETQEAELTASGFAPADDRESALVFSVSAGSYTAVLQGVNGVTGIGLLELYRID